MPTVTAIQFGNIQHGPFGVIRKVLWKYLPSWSLLGLDFVGASALEIITYEKIKARTVSTDYWIGIMNIQDFKVLGMSLSKPRDWKPTKERQPRYVERAARQLRKKTNQA